MMRYPFFIQMKSREREGNLMNVLEITDAEYDAFCAREEALKITNHQLRKEGETLSSELKAGAVSFDKKFKDEFYRMVVKR